MTRRRLLLGMLAGLLAAAAAAILWAPRALRDWLARSLEPRPDPSAPRGELTARELETLAAFGEVLVEGRILFPDERNALLDHVADGARRTPGYYALYRSTARILDGLTGKSFAALDLGQRTTLMVARRLVPSEAAPLDYVIPSRRQALAIRNLVVPDLIRGYYRSAAGWAVVGYRTFPGRCGDLIRYTRPEA